MYASVTCACLLAAGKNTVYSLELELEMVVSCLKDADN